MTGIVCRSFFFVVFLLRIIVFIIVVIVVVIGVVFFFEFGDLGKDGRERQERGSPVEEMIPVVGDATHDFVVTAGEEGEAQDG